MVGRRCDDSRHCFVPRNIMSYKSIRICAVAIVAEQAARYSASDVDIGIGTGIVELASISAPFRKIMYPIVDLPVSGQSCQLASEKTTRSE